MDDDDDDDGDNDNGDGDNDDGDNDNGDGDGDGGIHSTAHIPSESSSLLHSVAPTREHTCCAS